MTEDFGDLVCALIPVNYIIKNCPWINLLIWVPDFLIDFAKLVLPPGSIIRGYSEAKKKYDDTRAGISTKWDGRHSAMKTHPARYAYHVLADRDPTDEDMSYLKPDFSTVDLSKFNLPEKYVVLQAAYVEVVKTMPVKTFNDLVDYVISKGYTPVFMGKKRNDNGLGMENIAKVEDGYDLSKGINLIDNTDLIESTTIMNNAKAVVALDGGLIHLAGFTKTSIVCGYTFASPEQLMPYRDGIKGKDVYAVVPDASLACKFCQTNITLLYNHDFRNCFYKDHLCTKQMTSEKFINQLEKIL